MSRLIRVPDDNVAQVFKKGEKYDAANYRPMPLTCICCKTVEHSIVSNINKHLAFESILADCQHSFRSQRSCEIDLFSSTMTWSAIWVVH